MYTLPVSEPLGEVPFIKETEDADRPLSYDAGAFAIERSTTSPEGLEIVLTESAPRSPLIGTIDDLVGTQEVKVSAQEDRRKLSLEVVRQEGNILYVRVTPAFFSEYRELRDNPDVPKPTGTAMPLFTTEKDGSSKLLVQYRAAYQETVDEEGKVTRTGNKFYGGIPGASVAGIWNAQWAVSEGDKVKIINIDTSAALANIHAEMEHEIGLSLDDLLVDDSEKPSTRIVGFCLDNVNPHTEVMMYGKTKLSSDEIKQKAEKHKKQLGQDEFDFAEKFFFIDGTPEAIMTLLTQVQCPLPPTHAAAFEEAGYMAVLQRDGLEKALAWKEQMRLAIKENYEKIDEMVREFYKNNPDSYQANSEASQKEGRELRNGYDPAFSPEQQGLPEFYSEMRRTGLMQDEDIAA